MPITENSIRGVLRTLAVAKLRACTFFALQILCIKCFLYVIMFVFFLPPVFLLIFLKKSKKYSVRRQAKKDIEEEVNCALESANMHCAEPETADGGDEDIKATSEETLKVPVLLRKSKRSALSVRKSFEKKFSVEGPRQLWLICWILCVEYSLRTSLALSSPPTVKYMA